MIHLPDIQGHWRRHWIKAPGFEDHTTRVHWMQAGYDFTDVRIPLARPDPGAARCLADLPAPALAQLARAEGFAGHVTLEGDHCTWHRTLNWHGTPKAADVGAISFDDDGRMIEAGVLADYTELWAQEAKAEPQAFRFANDTHSGLLVTAGEVGVLAIGQTDKPATTPLLSALEQGTLPPEVDTLFDGVHALCHVSGDTLTATLATDPFAEGHPLLTRAPDHVIWHRTAFDGTTSRVAMPMTAVPA